MIVADVAYPAPEDLVPSPGFTTYLIDPDTGDDANQAGKPWKSFAKLNAMRLARGDQVHISPGVHGKTFKPSGMGTADRPIVVRFLPGVHTIKANGALRLPMFVSNSCDSPAPKPIGIMIQGVRHLRMEGGGVAGLDRTMILFDGRMVQIFNENSEDIIHRSGSRLEAPHGTDRKHSNPERTKLS